MSTLTELLTTPEFAKGSNAKRDELFNNWKQTTLEPGLAAFPTETERAGIRRQVDDFYLTANPPLEPNTLGDIGVELTASVDVAQGLGYEVASQINQGLTPGDEFTPRARELKQGQQAEFSEAEQERKALSDYSKDKALELKERVDLADTDMGKAAATVSFFLGSPENLDTFLKVPNVMTAIEGLLESTFGDGNIDQLVQLSAGSAAPSAVAVAGTALGGAVAGPAGAIATSMAVGGALGGAEASIGAYDKALDELKKQGVPQAKAEVLASDVSNTAFAIGGVGSALLEPLGESLPVIRSFARKAKRAEADATPDVPTPDVPAEPVTGVFAELSTGASLGLATGVVAEGIQGATTQVAENIAVNDVTPTEMFDGAITAGVTEALAAGPTIVATDVAVRAYDKALELMQTNPQRTEAEELLDGFDEQDQTTPEVTPDTPDLGRSNITDDDGGVDSAGSSVLTPPASSAAGDPATTQPPSTPRDTGGTEETEGAVSVPGEPTSTGTPDPASAAGAPDPAGVQSGGGATVSTDAGTDSGGDGVSGTTVATDSGTDGQQVSDSTPPVVDTDATVAGTNVTYGTVQETLQTAVPESPTIDEVVTATPPEAVQAFADAIEQGEDTTAAASKLINAYNVAKPTEQTPPDPVQDAWSAQNVGIDFTQLDPELAGHWREAVEDQYASKDIAERIARTQRNNDIVNRRKPAAQPAQAIPKDMVARMRDGVTTADTQAYEATNAPLPLVVDGGTSLDALPDTYIDTPLNLAGNAGIVNAAVKAAGESGTYIIADVSAGTAHIMTKAGSLTQSVPFVSGQPEATTHNVSSPTGPIAYQRISVRAKGQKRRVKDGVSRLPGMAMPAELLDAINPNGAKFSGNVYLVPTEQRVAAEPAGRVTPAPIPKTSEPVIEPTIHELEVNEFRRNIAPELAANIPDLDAGERPMQAVELVDQLLGHADTAPLLEGFYQDILTKIRPFLDGATIARTESPFGNEHTDGAYSSESDTVQLSNRSGLDYHTITHELVHAATVHALSDTRRSVATDAVKQQLVHALSMVRATPDLNAYGLTDIYEFVAEIYTNPNFRNAVNSIADVDSLIDTTGNRAPTTLWDRVWSELTKGLFRIESHYTTDNIVDWTELLFSTSRELQATERTEIGSKGRTADDILNHRTPQEPQEQWTRAGTVRRGYAIKNRFRTWIIDDVTPFLTFLNLRTAIPRITADHDGYKSWMLLKLIPQAKKTRFAKFMNNHGRRIEQQSEALFKKYGKASGQTASEIFEHAAYYATWSHIPNATRVAREGIQAEVDEATQAMAEAQAALEPGTELDPATEITLSTAINRAEMRLRLFNEAQAHDGLYGPNWPDESLRGQPLSEQPGNSYTIMGGMTAKTAEAKMQEMAERLAGPEGDAVKAREDLEGIRTSYVEAFRNIWWSLIANGEVSQAEADAHEASGLDRDYVPLTGRAENVTDDEQTPFGGPASSISAPVEQHRGGRLSQAENAYRSLVRKADNAASRIESRQFKEQLLADITSGAIPEGLAGWHRVTPNQRNSSRAPEGIKPIYYRTEDGTYEMWINDAKVMEALRNISGEKQSNGFLRAVGSTNRFTMRLYTFLDTMFGPVNALRTLGENVLNIGARDLGAVDDQGNPIDVNIAALRGNIFRNAFDKGLLLDTHRIYLERGFGGEPINGEYANSRMGKYFLEAEEAGVITIQTDSIEELWRKGPTTQVDKDMMRKLTHFHGEAMKASLEADGKKLTTKQLKALARETQGATAMGFDALYAVITYYNRMWDIRATVGTYAALRDAGVPKTIAQFRTLDLMNYTQKGSSAFARGMTAFMPFFRPAVNGTANTARTMTVPRGVAELAGMTMLGAGLYALSQLIAGDNDEDPSFVYNRLDAVPALTTRGNIPFILPGIDYVFKIPVPYGTARLAWVSGKEMVKGLQDSPLTTKEDGWSEVVKTALDEFIPTQTQINPLDGATSAAKFLALQMTPEVARGSVGTIMNTNEWGGVVDASVNQGERKYEQGYFRTEEQWKEASADLYRWSGGFFDWTPQQTKGHVMGVMQGVLSAPVSGFTAGDREAKGLPASARNELGYLNFFGLSKLFAKQTPPEERVARQIFLEYRRERKKYSGRIKETPPQKMTRLGPSRASREPKAVRVWDDAALIEDGKLYLKDIAEVMDAFEKDLRKISEEFSKPYNAAMKDEHAARKAGMGSGEVVAWSVGQDILNRPENKKIFTEGYLKQREVFRRFITLTNQIKNGK